MFLFLASRTEHMAEALNCGCAHLDCEDKFVNKDTLRRTGLKISKMKSQAGSGDSYKFETIS